MMSGGNICNNLRNVALNHLIDNNNFTGVIIFANLDRTYNSVLFNKIRGITKVGAWPVTFAEQTFNCMPKVSLPSNDDNVKYPFNIGSVALSASILKFKPVFNPELSDTAALSSILEDFISSADDIEPLFCNEEVVWYTPIF